VAQKWDHSDKRRAVGRPPTPQEVVDLVLQWARENPTWGYDRIADALANVGHKVSDQTDIRRRFTLPPENAPPFAENERLAFLFGIERNRPDAVTIFSACLIFL